MNLHVRLQRRCAEIEEVQVVRWERDLPHHFALDAPMIARLGCGLPVEAHHLHAHILGKAADA